MDFRKLISPKSQAEIAERSAALCAFQDLPPKDMAAELMTHVRGLRTSGVFSDEPTYSYDEWALYRVAPELANMLDPDFELQDVENPAAAEERDRVTYLRGAGPDKLRSAIESILSHGSFRRAEGRDRRSDVAQSADLTFGHKPTLFSIAADTAFPGIAPERSEADERAPLPGAYVIASGTTGYDKVLKYTEDMDDAERWFRVASGYHLGERCPEEDLEISNEIHRSRFHMEIDAVQLQDGSGQVLRETQVAPRVEEDALAEPGA